MLDAWLAPRNVRGGRCVCVRRFGKNIGGHGTIDGAGGGAAASRVEQTSARSNACPRHRRPPQREKGTLVGVHACLTCLCADPRQRRRRSSDFSETGGQLGARPSIYCGARKRHKKPRDPGPFPQVTSSGCPERDP